ncbi:MAG: hypothetical protein CVU38_20965 [Chloroflexi bacterium HGW-Chloroflexi-1]|nr:MAG: hypothetical protein CVU38_20965 [Chloroflexi bacterium HGW-Chloroflexi-1]
MPEVFRYKPLHGRLSPMVTIGVKLGDTWYPTEAYVDSVGFDYRAGNRIYVQVGDGSFIPIYLHDIEVQVGAERFVAKIAFSDKLGVTFNLLGRMGIFDRFKVCFNDRQGVLTFEALASQ